MEKIKVKMRNMCCQYEVKTRTDAFAMLIESGFETVKRTRSLSLSLIGGILIILFCLTGCSDVPYTGPTLTVDHVDRFLGSIDEDTACLEDGFDSVCIRLLPTEEEGYDLISADDAADGTIVHIHPTSIAYEFYYEDSLILRAERAMDTTQIIQELVDAGIIQPPPNSSNLGDGGVQVSGNTPQSWIIQIYYLDSFPRTNRRLTLQTSGLDIRVVEGLKMLPFTRRDLDIQDFTEIDAFDGRRGVQFFVETADAEITVQVDGLVSEHIATFHISADNVAYDEETNTLELEPIP